MVTFCIVWFGGQRLEGLAERFVMVGGCPSVTVTVCAALAVLLCASVAVHVIVVVPTG